MAADKLTVIGAGYVGLVTAVGLATRGHSVELVERSPSRLELLRKGQAPLFEAGLQDTYTAATKAGRLTITDQAAGPIDIAVLCVGTPIGDDGRSDLSQVRSAMEDLRAVADDRTILVVRSTLPVGASELVREWAPPISGARIFANPEFLRQGSALADFAAPSRVVIGHFADVDRDAVERVTRIFGHDDAPLLNVDMAAAELIKNGANAMLALKLSFANELSSLAEEVGTDVGDVLAGISADPRIGSAYLRPSYGFGGSCLPKELQTFAVAGRSVGLPMHVTTAASLANAASQERFADRIGALVGGTRGKNIGLLGIAFKAGTDDVRGSPALALASALLASGARVRAFDPEAGPHGLANLEGLELAKTAEEVFAEADAVVVATEWPQFAGLPFESLRATMRVPLIVDGRRLLDAEHLRSVGYRVATLGSPSLARA